MALTWVQALLLACGCGVMVAAAVHDVGFRTVPNCLPGALFAIGLGSRLAEGGWVFGLTLAGLVFAFAFLAWQRGWMGGGDVKLLAAAAIFVPPRAVPDLLLLTALAGAAIALGYWAGARLSPAPAPRRPSSLWGRALRCEQWRLRRRGPIPYAAAILVGALGASFAA